MHIASRSTLAKIVGGAALAAAAILPLTVPTTAHAWWRGGWGYGGGVYIGVPGVVVAPPAYYAPPPPAYYAPPVAYAPVWIAPHWAGGYWIRGHWR